MLVIFLIFNIYYFIRKPDQFSGKMSPAMGATNIFEYIYTTIKNKLTCLSTSYPEEKGNGLM